MKKSINLILLIFLLTCFKGIAQKKRTTSIKELKELNKRPLKVVLGKGNSKSIQIFNQNLKEAVLSEWKISKDIEFISSKEYKEHYKNKNQKNTYLKVLKYNDDNIVIKRLCYYGLNKALDNDVSFELKKNAHKGEYFVLIQNLHNYITSKALGNDINFKNKDKKAIQQYLLKQAAEAKEVLNSKTLLINRKFLNSKLDSKIKTYYPFNFKIVTEDEINEAIITNDSTKLILHKTSIIDADTGKNIMSFYFHKDKIKKTIIAPYGVGILGNKIKEENLKNLSSYLE